MIKTIDYPPFKQHRERDEWEAREEVRQSRWDRERCAKHIAALVRESQWWEAHYMNELFDKDGS